MHIFKRIHFFGELIAMRYVGKITTWKDDQGFGFITIPGRKDKIFVHIKQFENRALRPTEGDSLTFEIKLDDQHRSSALHVRYAHEKAKTKASGHSTIGFSHIFALTYCGALCALFMIGKIPFSVVAAYIILGFITFIVYAFDKSAAQNNQWRTQESTLHILSLMGGWIGALLAQKKLRHKSKKEEFQHVFWMTVILNCGAFGWLVTQGHFEYLRRVIGF